MKKISIYAFVAATVFSVGCQKSELEVFDTTENYIQFTSEDEDEEVEESVSFSMLPGATQATYNIDVEILGAAFDKDTEFKVTLIDTLTTAVAGEHYEALKSSYTFPAGVYETSFPITFYSTADMDDDMLYLQLKIEALGNVKPGFTAQTTRTIAVTNKLVQPKWWKTYVYSGTLAGFLGGYTVDKWKNFIAALTEAGYDVPNTDFTSFTYNDWYKASMILSKYIDEHQPVDEDGDFVTIPFPY